MPKRTYQPKKRRRARVHGFRSRSRTSDGARSSAPPPVQGPASPRSVSVAPAARPFATAASEALMQRQRRLTRATRISQIHRQGRSVANGLLVFRLLPNDMERSRFCIVAGKRVGNAVVRNRVKRRLREAVRNTPHHPGWDAVIMARRGSGSVDYHRYSARCAI